MAKQKDEYGNEKYPEYVRKEWTGDRKVTKLGLSLTLDEKKNNLRQEICKFNSALLSDTDAFLEDMKKFHQEMIRLDYNGGNKYIDGLYQAEIKLLDILIEVSKGETTNEEIKTKLQEIEWPSTSKNAKAIEIMKGILCVFLGTLTGLGALFFGAIFGLSVLAAQPLPAVASGAVTAGLSAATYALFDKGFNFFKSPKERLENSLEKLALQL